jgi:hypothetical protein
VDIIFEETENDFATIYFINFINDTKNKIREMFEETKKEQVVEYFAYGEVGMVDFGKYTADDLN